MFKNHISVALRNFQKRKSFTFINVLGLTVGMTVCLLILTYAKYEMSYDTFHSRANDIYRISVDIYNGEDFQIADAQCYPAAGKLAKDEFAEVEEYAMARKFGRMSLKNGDKAFNEDGVYFATPSWLEVFDWELQMGNRATALKDANTIVISESTAERYFGEEDPMGKMIKLLPGGGELPMLVTGVIKDVPENAHLKFDILVSYQTAVEEFGSKYDNFGGNNEYMYILANTALDNEFEKRFNATYFERTEPFLERGDSLDIQPLTDIHLNSDKTYEAETNGSQSIVNILLVVAIFVLIIAWVNFINLSTARAMERGKEVGVRKVLGSNKGALITQFLMESFMLNFLAVVLTLTCIQGVLPLFNEFAGLDLSFNVFQNTQALLQVAAILIIGSFASGIYPALVLSNYRPLAVISGRLKDSKGGLILRKGLVIFQFMITMLLLAGTVTIYQQVNHMRSQSLGVNIDQTIVIRNPVMSANDSLQSEHRKTLKSELNRVAQVKSVAYSETVFGQGTTEMNTTTGFYELVNKTGRGVSFSFFRVDEDFTKAFEFEILAGRTFDSNIENLIPDSGGYDGIMINETSRKIFGYSTNEEAVGQKINRFGAQVAIIGVFADYNHHSLKTKVDPTVLFFDRYGYASDYVSIKLNAGNNPGKAYKSILGEIEKVYRQVYPESDFDYFFLDENFEKQYQADRQFGTVFTTFAGITIFVAILGLFGLVLYEVQQRIKEIGIRKVLGASVGTIIKLLSSSFLKLISIAILLATPIAYFGMNEWLSGYAYRIELSVLLFIVPAVGLLLIALATVTTQAIKAANENPVKSLRYE
ncbi:ABC transporter permease [Roseivirga sp.]|uniref:ABC transporter permease n=1 Tax=Roseivirga sp. TaxID=1964215 RepID=UPI003B8C5629